MNAEKRKDEIRSIVQDKYDFDVSDDKIMVYRCDLCENETVQYMTHHETKGNMFCTDCGDIMEFDLINNLENLSGYVGLSFMSEVGLKLYDNFDEAGRKRIRSLLKHSDVDMEDPDELD